MMLVYSLVGRDLFSGLLVIVCVILFLIGAELDKNECYDCIDIS